MYSLLYSLSVLGSYLCLCLVDTPQHLWIEGAQVSVVIEVTTTDVLIWRGDQLKKYLQIEVVVVEEMIGMAGEFITYCVYPL